MAKVFVVADFKDKNFLSEIQNSVMLNEYDVDILTAKDNRELLNVLNSNPNATIVVRNNVLNDEDFALEHFNGYNIVGFAKNGNEGNDMKTHNISCYGIARTADKLCEHLSSDNPPMFYTRDMKKPQIGKIEPTADANREPAINIPKLQEEPQAPVIPEVPAVQTVPQQQPAVQAQTQQQMPMQFTPEQMAMMMQMMQMMQNQPQMQQQPQQPQPQTVVQQQIQQESQPAATQAPVQQKQEQKSKKPLFKKKQEQSIVQQEMNHPESIAQKTVRKELKRKLDEKDPLDESLIDQGIYVDRKKRSSKAIVATVYAAKGGVGKTTVATETAVYLSLIDYMGSKLSVCIVDYNIDFGDVCTHCELDPRGNSMVMWASEIDDMIKDGEKPENINFKESEIKENYLQRMDRTGLYALIAPTAHEDSMNISRDALRVMLRNLVENCGFDFVICDTGNNTRDAAIIALEMADDVFMIATQDVTTANCDASVLRVLEKIGMNTGKVKLIVNNVIPYRDAGVSVREVVDTFGLECVAKIHRTPDIIKANNLGRPLVFKTKHEFTKQIGNIADYLTSGIVSDVDVDADVKKPLFSGLFKK